VIQFPTAPAVGTLVTAPDGMQWRWDGNTWELVGLAASPPSAWKEPVVAASEDRVNYALSGLQSVDNIGTGNTEGKRVLLKDQTNPSQNGIYIMSAGAWQRAPDMVTEAQIRNAVVPVAYGGRINGMSLWMMTYPKPQDTWTGSVYFGRVAKRRSDYIDVYGSYTVGLADMHQLLLVNSATDCVITLPNNNQLPYGWGEINTQDDFEVHVSREGATAVSFVPAAGASIRSVGGKRKIGNQYGVVTARLTNAGAWLLFGDLAT
jgi:hypothetical protein